MRMVIECLCVLAQTAPATDPLSGGAGWVGAGLLGLVLAWLLLKYLPAKDTQQEKLIAYYHQQIESINLRCIEERRETLDKFDSALEKLTDRHSSDVKEVVREIKSQFEVLTKLVTGVANRT